MNQTTTSAEIIFYHDKLYCSIRGINKLAMMLLDKYGKFKKKILCDTNGKTPRHFNIDKNTGDIYIANQHSNNIVCNNTILYNDIKNPAYILL